MHIGEQALSSNELKREEYASKLCDKEREIG